ncbi:hypothetical protein [Pseudomonas sp. zfem002]|uniref:hypothetical protein n=1 Tax=Pseudomonas sp. zfem002 TaxID=3078197 RepID=UPI00292967BC|nr:hypothetical protein [Pseudomonas sp. zfem002]MDU9393743.1 hypothetical protein [Pseudomonas sp. zfem002]
MNPNDYMGRPLLDLVAHFKRSIPLVEYSKIDDDEFLKLPEQGVYFQAGSDSIVRAYRVYYQAVGEYFPADTETRYSCFGIVTVDDAVRLFGQPVRVIPSVRIPTRPPTNPGYLFDAGDERTVSVYHEADVIICIHVKLARQE